MFGLGHCASVERYDLVVRLIGVDKAQGGELVVDQLDTRGVNALVFHPSAVLAKILAGGRHNQRSLAQQCQGVGDIAGYPTAHAAHRIDQEADGQHMNLVR